MAAARRRALLLLRFILSLCCSCGFVAHGLKQGGNANLHPPPPPVVVVPVNRQLKLGASNSVNVGGAAAAVSGPRRAGGWRLAEEEACRGDVSRMCPKHTWSNNLAVLECLQDKKEVRHTPGPLLTLLTMWSFIPTVCHFLISLLNHEPKAYVSFHYLPS